MIHTNIGFAGRYRMQVRRPDGSVRIDSGWFDNLITNNGLDLLWTMPPGAYGFKYWIPQCFVGTGTIAPTESDTSLANWLVSVGTINDSTFGASTFVDEAGGEDAYWTATAYWRFGTGVAAGNLSEIGTGAAKDNIFSRALIVDGSGTPTTITVLADETLDVYYELRSYINKTAQPFTINISGVPHDCYVRPYNIDVAPDYSFALMAGGAQGMLMYAQETIAEPPTVYDAMLGNSAYTYAGPVTPYVPGIPQLTLRATWDHSQANFAAGITAFYTKYRMCRFLIWLNDPIFKASYQTLSFDHRLSWGRYTP